MNKKMKSLLIIILILVIIFLFYYSRPYNNEILTSTIASIETYNNPYITSKAYYALGSELIKQSEIKRGREYALKSLQVAHNAELLEDNLFLSADLANLFHKVEDSKNMEFCINKIIQNSIDYSSLNQLQLLVEIAPVIDNPVSVSKVLNTLEKSREYLNTLDKKSKVNFLSKLFKIYYGMDNPKYEDIQTSLIENLKEIENSGFIANKYANLASFFLKRKNPQEFLNLLVVIPDEVLRINLSIDAAIFFFDNNMRDEGEKFAELIDIENIMKIKDKGTRNNLLFNYSIVAHKYLERDILEKVAYYFEILIEKAHESDKFHLKNSLSSVYYRLDKIKEANQIIDELIFSVKENEADYLKERAYTKIFAKVAQSSNHEKAEVLLNHIQARNVSNLISKLAINLMENAECTESIKFASKIVDPTIKAETLAKLNYLFQKNCHRGISFREKSYLAHR
ncbi:MAG: hypothetical protein ACQESP_10615 [Candidatus Muiribacteriota bacterium]